MYIYIYIDVDMVLRDDSTCPSLSCNRTTAALLLQDHPSHALNTHPTLRRNHLEPLGNRKDPAAILGPGSELPGQCHTSKYESFEAFEPFESSQARGIIRYYTILHGVYPTTTHDRFGSWKGFLQQRMVCYWQAPGAPGNQCW